MEKFGLHSKNEIFMPFYPKIFSSYLLACEKWQVSLGNSIVLDPRLFS
jgi:hypothetical protein